MRRPWAGAAAFLALAAGDALLTPRRPGRVLAIAGPLAAEGVLFAAGALRRGSR